MSNADKEDEAVRGVGLASDYLITKLSEHKREKKTLLAPLHALKRDTQFSSWKDEFLPLVTWATLAVGLLDRDSYLSKFRAIIAKVKFRNDNFKEEIYLDHARLKNASAEQFDFVFEPILEDPDLRKKFSVLAEINSLPDQSHWSRHKDQNSNKDLALMQKGYMKCIDHQSQESTDIRWMLVMTHFANQKLVLGQENSEQRFRECVEYPNLGEQRLVRPFIRSTEIALRSIPAQDRN